MTEAGRLHVPQLEAMLTCLARLEHETLQKRAAVRSVTQCCSFESLDALAFIRFALNAERLWHCSCL